MGSVFSTLAKPKHLALIVLALIHISILLNKSFSEGFNENYWFDDQIYLGAGSVIFHRSDVVNKMTQYHPPLSFYLNSLLLGPNPMDWGDVTKYGKFSDEEMPHWEQFVDSIGRDLVRQRVQRHEDTGILFLKSRAPFVFLSVLLLVAIFLAVQPTGASMQLVAAGMYALSPLILSEAYAVMTDFTAAALFTFTLLSLRWKCRFVTGILLGCSLASKATGVLLVLPILVSVCFGPFANVSWKYRVLSFGRILMVGGFVLWALYGFQFESMASAEIKHSANPKHLMAGTEAPRSKFETTLPNLYRTRLPAVSYLVHLRYIWSLKKWAFLQPVPNPFGSTQSPFLYGAMICLSYYGLGFWILAGWAVFLFLKSRPSSPGSLAKQDLNIYLWVLAYLMISLFSAYQCGPRHYLVMYPIMIVCLGSTVAHFLKKHNPVVVISSVALGVILDFSFFIFANTEMNSISFLLWKWRFPA